tara:strand:+ start:383 stop:1390 length:1008 start_codon:yes stop_codon:yes gene_type:complete
MKNNFWKNRKIFITGIDGFVGSNLAKALIQNGSKVYGLVKDKKKESLLKYEKLINKCKIYKGDIKDKKILSNIIKKNKVEVCFHLAAQPEVGIANKDPYNTWETNIKGTYNLLETIRDNKKHIKSIIIASSDKAYGDYPKKDLPYREDYHLKPRYPYDVSKACADMISKAYTTELFNLPIIITRFSNIYGPGQLNFSTIFPDAIRCIIKNKKFIPRSDGKDFRDFIFIKDIVDVYLLLARKLYFKPSLSGEVFNAGNNKPITVKNLLQKIYFHQNKKTEYLEIVKLMKNKNTTGEIKFQSMNYRKLNKFFRWKPKYNIEKSLNITFAWYRKYLNK